MFKKLIVGMFTFCLVLTHSQASSMNGIKAAYDELNYALTVEWDQKDRAFYDSHMEKFAQEMRELQAQGLTNQEIIDFTLTQIKDEKIAKDLRTAYTMVMVNKLSPEEAQVYVKDALNKSYSQGASWGGSVIVGAVVLLALIAAAALVVGQAKIEDDCYKVRTCEEVCYGGLCYEECDFRCI